jgi:putative transposase
MTTQNRQPYPSDLSDAEWQFWEQVLSSIPRTPNFDAPKYPRREILNAILYRQRTGCQWRYLPHDFPPWQDVVAHFYRWRDAGIFERARDRARRLERESAGRQTEPTLGIVDSQSVKATESGGDKGFDAGKKTKGRKRHILVDTFGLVVAVLVTSAGVQDRDGFAALMAKAVVQRSSLVKVLVDGAYRGAVIDAFTADTGIRVEVSSPPPGQKGFVVVRKRWVVERTFGWLNRERILAKCYDRRSDCEESWINLSIAHLLGRRLSVNSPA